MKQSHLTTPRQARDGQWSTGYYSPKPETQVGELCIWFAAALLFGVLAFLNWS